MAHLIDIGEDGTAAFVSANKPAWHQLGTVVPGPMTVADALKLAKLDNWDVRLDPAASPSTGTQCPECSAKLGATHGDMCEIGDHEGEDDTRLVVEDDCVEWLTTDDYRAVTRISPFTGKRELLSFVGPEYTPISNELMGETLVAILDQSGAVVDTAGALRGGKETFITARIPKGIMVGGVDPVQMNLAALGYFHQGRANEFLATMVRVVCANTQTAAIHGHVSRWAFRHTPSGPDKVANARDALKITFDYADAFAEEAEKMIGQDLAIKEFEALCREIWPAPADDARSDVKERDDLLTTELMTIFKGDTNANIGGRRKKGTHWSGFQTIGEYIDHRAPVAGENAATARAERALMGRGNQIKHQAFKLFQVA
ncbi:phage/plasmid-like protein TIGR03299 [Actinokineospora terrae]|uniref:Phage/plasmid-like protein TIGR03299 n=2 Tax=Actinokineospora terrae TaxID=155974 RepID=A0A1H9XSH5_9PSEU|nr:phage/plasmid-like protein TIGR03299 [Actinokineospora terrae]